MSTDQELLETFADHRCEEAFRVLVERHSGMVYASALRRTGDPVMAEEAAQNVFIILARKAEAARRYPVLRAWLHTTTRLQCQNVLRRELRHQRKRQALMKQAQDPLITANPQTVIDESRPFMDQALDELNDAERQIILLRFADEAGYAEISQRLGKSEAACRKRVSRVLEKLSRTLRRKGVAIPVTLVGATLTAQMSKAAATGMAGGLAQNALTNLTAVSTLSLITNTLETMAYGKTKAFLAATALAAIPISMQWQEIHRLKRERDSVQSVEVAAGDTLTAKREAAAPSDFKAAELTQALTRAEQDEPLPSAPGDLPAVPGLAGEGLVFPLPFEDIESLFMNPIDESGLLTEQMARLLRLSNEEVRSINETMAAYRKRIWEIEKENVTAVTLEDEEQVYEIEAFPETGELMKEELETFFHESLGEERGDFLATRFFGTSQSTKRFGLFGERHRTISFKPLDDDKIQIKVSEHTPDGGARSTYSNTYSEVPEEFRHLFQLESSEEGLQTER